MQTQEQASGAVVKVSPTREQFEAYRAAFEFFNVELFGGTLPEPVLNFSRHANSYGFFAPCRWNRPDQFTGAKVHEISLNPDTLNERGVRATLSTLVHEMVHLWQEAFGKTPRRGYHDRQWAEKMDSIGLVPSHNGKPGGKRTGPKITHFIQDGGPYARAFAKMPETLHLPWRAGHPPIAAILAGALGTAAAGGVEGEAEPKRPKKIDPSKIKYSCAGCKSNVWGKLGLRIKCAECDEPFVSTVDAEAA